MDGSHLGPVEVHPVEPDPNRVDPNRADPNRADPNRVDPNRADPNRADPNRADPNNTWFVSMNGSDAPDCGATSRPCRHLRTVLTRARHGADIVALTEVIPMSPRVRLPGGRRLPVPTIKLQFLPVPAPLSTNAPCYVLETRIGFSLRSDAGTNFTLDYHGEWMSSECMLLHPLNVENWPASKVQT